ncbi:MAG TPA: hypothetical protein VM368_07050 [Flavisolibacter sp.]|nr:hypothetical protein [Flavisolibacter sp.]
MKKLLQLAAFIAVAEISFGQDNTYPWPSSGSIGIGTTSPVGKFSVYLDNIDHTNTGGIGSHILLTNPNAQGQNVVSSVINGNTAAKWRTDYVGNISWVSGATASDRGHYFYVGGDYPSGSAKLKITPTGVAVGSSIVAVTPGNYFEVYQSDNITRSFIVTATGNVGIGTSNPQTKLAVNGDISSKKVKVTQSGWPDYVFHKNYKLPSLSEVEKFIRKHNHLPGVASAKEIEDKGLDLGDSQAQLLKKIEELTLYVIDLKKQVDGQKKEIFRIEETSKKQVNSIF